MIFADIEQAIAQRLAPLRASGILTRALPNKPSEWGKEASNGVITLRWEKDDFQAPETRGAIAQQVQQTWKLDIRLKNLRDANGGWTVLQEITRLLLGFKPPHCNKIFLKSREFLGELEGVWVFEVAIVAPTLVVEWDEAAEAPTTPLAGIFVLDAYGGLELGTAAN